MKLKKIGAFLICSTAVIALAACKKGKTTTKNTTTNTTTKVNVTTSSKATTKQATTTNKHIHNFDQKNTSDAYLKSEATCQVASEYYYSCSCGEKGSTSFTGEKAPHKEVFDGHCIVDECEKNDYITLDIKENLVGNSKFKENVKTYAKIELEANKYYGVSYGGGPTDYTIVDKNGNIMLEGAYGIFKATYTGSYYVEVELKHSTGYTYIFEHDHDNGYFKDNCIAEICPDCTLKELNEGKLDTSKLNLEKGKTYVYKFDVEMGYTYLFNRSNNDTNISLCKYNGTKVKEEIGNIFTSGDTITYYLVFIYDKDFTLEVSEHVHNYEKILDDKFLASSATCEDKATYYYGCECGEHNHLTYENGTALGHNYIFDGHCINEGCTNNDYIELEIDKSVTQYGIKTNGTYYGTIELEKDVNYEIIYGGAAVFYKILDSNKNQIFNDRYGVFSVTTTNTYYVEFNYSSSVGYSQIIVHKHRELFEGHCSSMYCELNDYIEITVGSEFSNDSTYEIGKEYILVFNATLDNNYKITTTGLAEVSLYDRSAKLITSDLSDSYKATYNGYYYLVFTYSEPLTVNVTTITE